MWAAKTVAFGVVVVVLDGELVVLVVLLGDVLLGDVLLLGVVLLGVVLLEDGVQSTQKVLCFWGSCEKSSLK